MLNTFAQEVLYAYSRGFELQAYEFAYDKAASVSEAHDHDMIRFEDNTQVRVYMSDDHEITIIEA